MSELGEQRMNPLSPVIFVSSVRSTGRVQFYQNSEAVHQEQVLKGSFLAIFITMCLYLVGMDLKNLLNKNSKLKKRVKEI